MIFPCFKPGECPPSWVIELHGWGPVTYKNRGDTFLSELFWTVPGEYCPACGARQGEKCIVNGRRRKGAHYQRLVQCRKAHRKRLARVERLLEERKRLANLQAYQERREAVLKRRGKKKKKRAVPLSVQRSRAKKLAKEKTARLHKRLASKGKVRVTIDVPKFKDDMPRWQRLLLRKTDPDQTEQKLIEARRKRFREGKELPSGA